VLICAYHRRYLAKNTGNVGTKSATDITNLILRRSQVRKRENIDLSQSLIYIQHIYVFYLPLFNPIAKKLLLGINKVVVFLPLAPPSYARGYYNT
jgi:hypothetical protein